MKKLLLGLVLPIITLLFSSEVKATHVAGAEITYLHSPTTANPDRYYVTLTVYKDAFGIGGQPLPPTQSVCFTSSCSTFNEVLNCTTHPYFYEINANNDTVAVGCGDDVPEQDDCAEPAAIGVSGALFEVYAYRGYVTIPKCVDWTMQWDLCCRNGAITNGFDNDGFSISSFLNNQISHNSSPQFLKPGIKRFCVVDLVAPNPRPFNWDHPVIEPDGDSLYYRFSTPRRPGAGCSEVDLVFSGANTETNPMPTHFGFAIDRKFGFFTFMPSLAGVYVVLIEVEEYRFNPVTIRWEKISVVRRDMQVPVDAACKAKVKNGPRLNTSITQYSIRCLDYDSIASVVKKYRSNLDSVVVNNDLDPARLTVGDTCYQIPVIEYSCNNRSIDLVFSEALFCPTIDRTDVLLIGPDGISRPIQSIESTCTPLLRETNQIRLVLHQTLDLNGEYLLYFKRGNDGNTMENKCGYEVDDFYYQIVKVTDCKDIKYELNNVTVENDERIKLEFEYDTTTFSTKTFRGLNILRANNDLNFQFVGIQNDVNARTFVDSTLDAYAVDNQVYQYLIQIVTNFNAREPSNIINSILLKGDTINETQLELTWEPYGNGTYGAPADYEVFVSDYDTTGGGPTWTSVRKVGTALTYIYDIPENKSVWLKVQASDPSLTNTLLSNSNWIITGSYEPPVPPTLDPAVTYVPNIITPNGDNINDRFYFSLRPTDVGLRQYSNLSLSIFNRWGERVFQDDNYMDRNNKTEGWDGTNDANGSQLADGVYFYIAKFSDVGTGKSEEKNGTITLSASR